MKKKICILNYGVGNFFSIYKALKEICNNTLVSNIKADLKKSDCIVLPGVGSFLSAINFMKKTEVLDIIQEHNIRGKQIVGICLGMQILMSHGNEDGYTPGLNMVEGESIRIPLKKNYKIPNVGLREIQTVYKKEIKNFSKFHGKKFYHLHSYKIKTKEKFIYAWSHAGDYKYNIPAIIKKDNITGLQFHPEISGKDGFSMFKSLLKN